MSRISGGISGGTFLEPISEQNGVSQGCTVNRKDRSGRIQALRSEPRRKAANKGRLAGAIAW